RTEGERSELRGAPRARAPQRSRRSRPPRYEHATLAARRGDAGSNNPDTTRRQTSGAAPQPGYEPGRQTSGAAPQPGYEPGRRTPGAAATASDAPGRARAPPKMSGAARPAKAWAAPKPPSGGR